MFKKEARKLEAEPESFVSTHNFNANDDNINNDNANIPNRPVTVDEILETVDFFKKKKRQILWNSSFPKRIFY